MSSLCSAQCTRGGVRCTGSGHHLEACWGVYLDPPALSHASLGHWSMVFVAEPGLWKQCVTLSHLPLGQVGLALIPVPVWGQWETPTCFPPTSALWPGALLHRRRVEASANTGRGGMRSRFLAGEVVGCLETSSLLCASSSSEPFHLWSIYELCVLCLVSILSRCGSLWVRCCPRDVSLKVQLAVYLNKCCNNDTKDLFFFSIELRGLDDTYKLQEVYKLQDASDTTREQEFLLKYLRDAFRGSL